MNLYHIIYGFLFLSYLFGNNNPWVIIPAHIITTYIVVFTYLAFFISLRIYFSPQASMEMIQKCQKDSDYKSEFTISVTSWRDEILAIVQLILCGIMAYNGYHKICIALFSSVIFGTIASMMVRNWYKKFAYTWNEALKKTKEEEESEKEI